jgi:hypothetical protein
MSKEPSDSNHQNSTELGITQKSAGDENESISGGSNFEHNSSRVTPWEVEGQIDYSKLVKEFGTQQISSQILEQFERITGDVHPMLRLHYFFSHRDLDVFLRKVESDDKTYLYTGRGPSGMVHMGHLMPWIFTKYLQDKF